MAGTSEGITSLQVIRVNLLYNTSVTLYILFDVMGKM